MKVCDQTFQAIPDCIERERERVPGGWVPGGLMKEGGALRLGFFFSVYIYIYNVGRVG